MFRLPTEAEWEYACKAGSLEKYQLGDTVEDLSKVAWHRDNIPTPSTQPVGQKAANQWGIYDMLGNVMELCLDSPVDYPDGTTQIDWVGTGKLDNMFYNMRGGSVFNQAGIEDNLTCFRRAYTGSEPHMFNGCRLCLGLKIKLQD